MSINITAKGCFIYRILIVEDELAIQDMYRYKFEAEGFEVHVASNGITGYEQVEKLLPDLVLLDIRMPHMNGDEMLVKVREQEWGADIRVIILTNLSKDEAPSILRMLRVDRYIVKAHYTPAEVVKVVREVLQA